MIWAIYYLTDQITKNDAHFDFKKRKKMHNSKEYPRLSGICKVIKASSIYQWLKSQLDRSGFS